MHREQRLRLRLTFAIIILATLPCYCLGWSIVQVAEMQAALPTATITHIPTPTTTPTIAPLPTVTAVASIAPLPPSVTPSATLIPTVFYTWTATFTLLPTDTMEPPPPTFTEEPPPTFTEEPTPTITEEPPIDTATESIPEPATITPEITLPPS